MSDSRTNNCRTGVTRSSAATAQTLSASVSLAEVYGPGLVFNGYIHPRYGRWLTRDSFSSPGYGASALAIAGEMPVLCYQPCVRPEILALLREAGLGLPPEIHVFHDHRDYLEQLRWLAGSGWRFVHQYVQPSDEADPASYWIDRQILARLNNKGELGHLVPRSNVPRRRLLAPAELSTDCLPCVVKACTDEPSGMGNDVRLCDSTRDLEQARRYFQGCERVVVEEWLDIAANLCLNFAVRSPADISYLGAAEQIVKEDGYFQGNWIAPDIEVPGAARDAGMAIARKAGLAGYRGIFGMDTAVLADGRVRVYDLNFRLNNSTRAILLRDSITARFQATVLRAVSLKMMAPYQKMLSVVRAALERGHLLPLWLLSGNTGANGPETENRLKGIVLGNNRVEVAERLERLSDEGFQAGSRIV